ncbi:hypothetical protein LTR72_004717 [Exophiala xenobiotica]|nr:hypothetical protein LTR92_000109 [Exophiala xenobiotica]KAK5224935.1 hypothetical protein LTR72_004717 [Exophiala xenobiotica]KAK5294018.1 hypothetical protein LTR14_004910 [Exophiala xenobiotica]KAK5421853.1 hypothetical protein LTR06_000109 [Exophiala xenobiotica]KAK5497070.1 hypothetical protein LTR55_001561 [Exophiala xenobiotica]
MTSTNSAEHSESRSAAQDIPQQPRPQEEVHTPTPVEMSSLAKNNPLSSEHDTSSSSHRITTSAEPHMPGPMRTDTTTALNQSMNPAPSPPPAVADPQAVTRTFSTAIGPSSDSPVVPAKDVEVSGPVLVVTLLLTSGARHPFRLDAKYLAKRNVEVADADPYNLSVYKLKELILREWREEWEAKPSSPNYIRLISMGKMLDDKASLKDYKFGTDSPNVLHMTIKPQDYVEDEDAKGGKSSMAGNRESEGRSPGCRCIIM